MLNQISRIITEKQFLEISGSKLYKENVLSNHTIISKDYAQNQELDCDEYECKTKPKKILIAWKMKKLKLKRIFEYMIQFTDDCLTQYDKNAKSLYTYHLRCFLQKAQSN